MVGNERRTLADRCGDVEALLDSRGAAGIGSGQGQLDGAFSNPRMILKWGGLGKGTALGVDLLSEVFEGGGGLRGRGKLRKLLPGSQNCVELPSPPPSNAETRAVRPGLKTLGFTSGSGTGPAVSS